MTIYTLKATRIIRYFVTFRVITMSLQNGGFLVRDSRHAGADKPYVMTILCRTEIFHVPIRHRTKDALFAVGEEKDDELVNCRILFIKCTFYFKLSWLASDQTL